MTVCPEIPENSLFLISTRSSYMVRTDQSLMLVLGTLFVAMLFAAGCTTAPGPNASTGTLATTLATPGSQASPATVEVNLSIRDELAARAATYAAGIDGDLLARAVALGPNSTEFVSVQRSLQALQASDPKAAFIYTVEQRNESSRFMVDAAFGTPNGSSPGDVLIEVPNGLPASISTPGATGIYTDQWGTFVSGYAPVRNRSGSIVGVLVVDVRPDDLE